MNEISTIEKIHKIAAKEFLSKGFRGASLREIVKKAGVTTGAFYGYYKSKEELFDALVAPHGDYVLDYFKKTVSDFMSLPKCDWAGNMALYSDRGMRNIFDYACEHKDAFRLILSASEGTRWENFIHKIVEGEIEITHLFYKEIEKEGYKPFAFNPTLEHMIISSEFSAFFELIIHDISKEDSLRCLKELHDFYQAAWASVLKIKK